MRKSMLEIVNSNIGAVMFTIVPATIGYFAVAKDFINLALSKELKQDVAIIVFISLWILTCAVVYLRRSWLSFKKATLREIDQLKSELTRKSSGEQLINCLTQLSDLWKQHNMLRNEFESLRQGNILSSQQFISICRTVVSIANAASTPEELQKIADVLYNNHPIPEYEKIGIKAPIIKLMKARYHTEELEKAKQ